MNSLRSNCIYLSVDFSKGFSHILSQGILLCKLGLWVVMLGGEIAVEPLSALLLVSVTLWLPRLSFFAFRIRNWYLAECPLKGLTHELPSPLGWRCSTAVLLSLLLHSRVIYGVMQLCVKALFSFTLTGQWYQWGLSTFSVSVKLWHSLTRVLK